MLNIDTKKVEIVYQPYKVKGGVDNKSRVKIKKVLNYTAGKRHVWVEAEDENGKAIRIRKPINNIDGQNN